MLTRWLAKSGVLSLGVDLAKGAPSIQDRTSLAVHIRMQVSSSKCKEWTHAVRDRLYITYKALVSIDE